MITLDWASVSGATSYEVQQGDRGVNPGWDTLDHATDSIVFNGSSAVISGLVNGNSYSHRVRSVDGNARSGWSDQEDTSLLPVTGSLAGIKAIDLGSKITIAASLSPSYVAGRLIFTGSNVITTASVCPERHGRNPAPPISFQVAFSITFIGCTPGTSTITLMPSYSNDSLATLTVTVLEPAPTGFNAELASDGQSVELSWTHSGYGKHYQIASRNHSDDDWTYVEANEPSPSNAERTVTLGKPECGNTRYEIRAKRAGGGAWGTPASDSVTRNCDPPPAPTGLSVTAKSDSAMDLVWDFSGNTDAVTDYRVEYQVLPADSWTVWPHVEKYPGNAVRIRGLTCNTGYRLRLSLLGDGDVYDDQEWSGASNTIEPEPPTDACFIPDADIVTEKTFSLIFDDVNHGNAVLRITWRPMMTAIEGTSSTQISIISHGVLVTISDSSYARVWFHQGKARAELSVNDDIWKYYVYSYTPVYDATTPVVPSSTAWGQANSTAPGIVDLITTTTPDRAETIDDIDAIAVIDMLYLDPSGDIASHTRRFVCRAVLNNMNLRDNNMSLCIGIRLAGITPPSEPVQ